MNLIAYISISQLPDSHHLSAVRGGWIRLNQAW